MIVKAKTKIIIELIIGLIILISIIYKVNLNKKTKTFIVEKYPIEIELKNSYTLIEDENSFDFYATDNKNIYFGVLAYKVDDYDNFIIEDVLNDKIKYLESTRDGFELVEKEETINTDDSIITTAIYLGVKDNSAKTIYMLSTISFNTTKNYKAMVIQTCKKADYDKYKSEMLKNLTNIRIRNEANVQVQENIIEFPDRIFDLSIFVVDEYNGEPLEFDENKLMWIDLNDLQNEEKVFSQALQL